ncbi:hypothetical protein [Bacillus cereus group sp. BceL008]|uniref:hypothetical protein n=1 Tax=Bacillus cereus group sp. BceL008 TaxID=3445220 RepID=UPI003F248CA5
MKISDVIKIEFPETKLKTKLYIPNPIPMEIAKTEEKDDFVIVIDDVVYESKDICHKKEIRMGLHIKDGKGYYHSTNFFYGLEFGSEEIPFLEYLIETKEFQKAIQEIEVIQKWYQTDRKIIGTFDIEEKDNGEKERHYKRFEQL